MKAPLNFWTFPLLFLLVNGCGKGSMPSQSAAIAVQQDAFEYIEAHSGRSGLAAELPPSIVKLKPIRAKSYGDGLLIIFRQRFVEDYGFYYCAATNQPPAGISNYCQKISPGLFQYYNPG